MADINDSITNRFNDIERRLKGSFGRIKEDMDVLKKSIESNRNPTKQEDNSLLKEISEQIIDLKNSIPKIPSRKEVREEARKEIEKETARIKEEIRKEISDTENKIKGDIRGDIREEIIEKIDRLNRDIQRASKTESAEMKKQMVAVKEDLSKISEELKNEWKNQSASVKRELTKTRNEFAEKTQQNSLEIENLNEQIQYLRGRLNKISREKTEEKEKIDKIEEKSPRSKGKGFKKVLIILAILIPLLLIGYIVYANAFASYDFTYNYKIGSIEDSQKPYLTPASRTSEILNGTGDNYRNILNSLVYFDVPIPRGSDSLDIAMKMGSNLPDNGIILLGERNKEEWSYLQKSIYNPLLESLNQYSYKGYEVRIYSINKNMPTIENISEIPKGAIVATNIDLPLGLNNQSYTLKNLTINTGLRGGHTFYVYLKDSLHLKIKKQDLNWYNNEDSLTISLQNANGDILANTTIADDGITTVNKSKTLIQEGSLDVENLTEGTYKLVFSNFDGIIKELSLNTNKIITNSLFLADANVYNNGTQKPATLYMKGNEKADIQLLTYHKQGLQNVTINGKNISLTAISQPVKYPLAKGDYILKTEKNDLIISSTLPISFSKDSYFNPFTYYITPIPQNISNIKGKVDYVVTDYAAAEKEGNWIIGKTSFDLKDAYIKDGKLSMLISMPHLNKEETQNDTIPIDWINITVHKHGIL